MPQLLFYRYVDVRENKQIKKDKRIALAPGQTFKYYTPDRYDRAADAQRFLALSYPPHYRVGPIPDDELPNLHVQLRSVAPANGQPGGGQEVATTQTLFLFEHFLLQ